MPIPKLLCSSASCAVLSMLVPGAPAYAQQDQPHAVEEIIVTAQKREQRLQDVPIVVTAVSGQLLQDTGVHDIKELTVLTPGLLVTSTTSESVTTARIRGVGTVGDNPGLESSVGVVVDGVYRPRNGVGFGDLGELERVEVLKGPQGTLFGKNTSAGVINVLTKAPEATFGATSEVTVGNYGAVGVSQSVTGPLAKGLDARLYAAARQRDGFQDVVTGPNARRGKTDDMNQDFWTVRGQLYWTGVEGLNVRVIADYSKREEDCCTAVQLVNGPFAAIPRLLSPGAGVIGVPDPGARRTFSNRGTAQDIEDKGVSVQADWDAPWFGGSQLTSITAVRDWKTVNGLDGDFTSADLLYRDADGSWFRRFKQFSQELRLSGETEKLSWLVGGFYADETLDSTDTLATGAQWQTYLNLLFGALGVNGVVPNYPLGLNQDDVYRQKAKSWAFFTNNTYRFTDQLELTLGLRYTAEDKDLTSAYHNLTGGVGGGAGANPCGPAALGGVLANPAVVAAGGVNSTAFRLYAGYVCASQFDRAFTSLDTRQSRKEREWSGTAKLAYRFNGDLMTYASYARGYKAGGFNLDRSRIAIGVPDPNTAFPGEFVDSYELGVKSSWFNKSLLLNAAAFYQEYEDFQLNTFIGIAFVVLPVPKVKSRGIDADFIWSTPLDGLSLQGGVTYAVTEYGGERPNISAFDLPGSVRTPAGGSSYRLPGSRLSLAPLWSASLSAGYHREIGGDLTFRANASMKYTSSYNTGSDLLPSKIQPELTLFNARLGVGRSDERWMLEIWGANLTDKTYYQVAFDGPFQPNAVNAFLGAPRTFGATVRFKY